MAKQNIIKTYLEYLYRTAYYLNTENIITALKKTGPHKTLLDVGCWDGIQTLEWIKAAGSKNTYGIEPIKSVLNTAKRNGVIVAPCKADSGKWPFKNSQFNCIISNQVVEHLNNIDDFLSECARTLKPDGILITSTNNLSSLHNIFSLFFGWAPFDLTNSSKKVLGIGNPFALHRSNTDERGGSWTHKCIYTKKWFNDWQALYGLKPHSSYGAGLYPFPASIGKYVQKYCAFMTLVSVNIKTT